MELWHQRCWPKPSCKSYFQPRGRMNTWRNPPPHRWQDDPPCPPLCSFSGTCGIDARHFHQNGWYFCTSTTLGSFNTSHFQRCSRKAWKHVETLWFQDSDAWKGKVTLHTQRIKIKREEWRRTHWGWKLSVMWRASGPVIGWRLQVRFSRSSSILHRMSTHVPDKKLH